MKKAIIKPLSQATPICYGQQTISTTIWGAGSRHAFLCLFGLFYDRTALKYKYGNPIKDKNASLSGRTSTTFLGPAVILRIAIFSPGSGLLEGIFSREKRGNATKIEDSKSFIKMLSVL